MRYPLHKQIKEILKTVIEALEYVQESKNIDMGKQLLSDGNHAIEQISEKIIEHKNSIKSQEIFNLCTFLMENFPSAQDKLTYLSDFDGIVPLINASKELLDEINRAVDTKISVVFFAELGQKWDAMNSLYEAFKERGDCEVEVVLTPIFRQVQDGDKVRKEVIYEDYLTELGIAHTPYENYDIALDPPDMAFISNPYESVTEPQFWPENIAKYTSLVYVPYYTKNSLNDSLMQTESRLPFINEAWKIVVQSEEVENAYKQYSSDTKDNFLVSDLPKWDELTNVIEKKDVKNVEWKKLNGKTIFLWNIHYSINSPVSTFLENAKELVQIFEDNGDIGLIFRPHPMTETIFKLYQPEKQQYWKEIKKRIINSNNMVIDSNSSYKKAFAYSDALLSEHSSLLFEYAFLRKPILWLKKEETDQYFEMTKWIEPINLLKQAYTSHEIKDFILSVMEDPVKENHHMEKVTENLAVIDGKNGERISKVLLNAYLDEI